MPRNRRHLPAPLLAPLLAACTLPAGCNIVGPAYVLLHGPEKTPAEHTLDKERKTVVFIDDRANVVSRRSTRLQVATEMEETLAQEGVVLELVRAQAIMAAASLDSHAEPRSIAELGRDVGADVVIYATVDYFGLSPDGATYHPTAQFRLKVIDTETGDRLWPERSEGHQVLVQMQVRPEDMPQSMGEVIERESMLAEWAGRRLAEVFYDHVEANESRVGRPQDSS